MKEYYSIILTTNKNKIRFILFESLQEANDFASLLATKNNIPWQKMYTGNLEDYYESNDEECFGSIKVIKDKEF